MNASSFFRPVTLVVAAAAALFFFGGTSVSQAGNLHFVGGVTTQVIGNEIVISGKVAGLGNGDITYEVQVDAELTIYLVNPGAKGNKPPGQNKEPLKAADAGVLDGSEKNGQFTFTIRIDMTDAIADAVAATAVKQNWFAEAGALVIKDVNLSISQDGTTITAP